MSAITKVMKLEEAHPLERDARIKFVEETHEYFIDQAKTNGSVTGFVHAFFPHFDQEAVSKSLASRKLKKTSEYYGKTQQEILDMWEEKAESGSQMHLNIELYWNEEPHETKSKEFRMFTNFVRNVMDKLGLKPFRTELVIFGEDENIAGSVDFIAIDPKTGELVIFDWKRCGKIEYRDDYGKKGYGPCKDLDSCNTLQYNLQLNTYKWIVEKYYGHKVRDVALVFLHPKQEDYVIFWGNDQQERVTEMFRWRQEGLLGEMLELLGANSGASPGSNSRKSSPDDNPKNMKPTEKCTFNKPMCFKRAWAGGNDNPSPSKRQSPPAFTTKSVQGGEPDTTNHPITTQSPPQQATASRPKTVVPAMPTNTSSSVPSAASRGEKSLNAAIMQAARKKCCISDD